MTTHIVHSCSWPWQALHSVDQCVRTSIFTAAQQREGTAPNNMVELQPEPQSRFACPAGPETDSHPQGRAFVRVNLSPSKEQGLRVRGMGLASCDDHPAWCSVCASMSSVAGWVGMGGWEALGPAGGERSAPGVLSPKVDTESVFLLTVSVVLQHFV